MRSVCCISVRRPQCFVYLSNRYFRCHYNLANLVSIYFTVHDAARFEERSLLVKNGRPLAIINRPEAPVPGPKPVLTEEPAMPGVHVLPLLFYLFLRHCRLDILKVQQLLLKQCALPLGLTNSKHTLSA